MADIATINGTNISAISTINGVSMGAINTINGCTVAVGETPTLYIIIDPSYVDEDLTNFPVGVYLDSSLEFLQGISATDWQYLQASVDGVVCNIEVDVWDVSTPTAVLWINVPTVSSTYYTLMSLQLLSTTQGQVGETGDAVAQSVWPSDHNLVYHLSQDPSASDMLDSTVNENNGVVGVMASEDSVYAGFGKALDFDGTTDAVVVTPDSDSLDVTTTFTITTMLNLRSIPTWLSGYNQQISVVRKYDATDRGWSVSITSNLSQLTGIITLLVGNASSYLYLNANTALSEDTDYVITCTYDGTNLEIFINGDSDSSAAVGSVSMGMTGDFEFPLQLGGSRIYDGTMSEIFYTNTVLSDAWIKAVANNLLGNLATITTRNLQLFGSSLIGETVVGFYTTQSMSGCSVSDDGSILLVCGSYADVIYVLTGTNINDYVLDSTVSMDSTYHNALRGVVFSPDGYKLFVTATETGYSLTSQDMTTAFDLSTLGSVTRYAIGEQSYSLTFNEDGTKLGINHRDSSVTVQSWFGFYSLSTAYDVTTATLDDTLDIGDSVDYNAVITPDGLYIIVLNRSDYILEVITLNEAWTASVLMRRKHLTLDASATLFQGMYCKANGLDYDLYFTDSNYSGIDIVRQIRFTYLTSEASTIYATVDSSLVGSELTNQVIKVSFDDAHAFIYRKEADDWQYLHATIDSVECYVEIVAWNMDSRYAVINVLVPTLSSTTDTTIALSFGALNTATYVGWTGSVAAQAVWPDHTCVYHLQAGPEDSSTNAADGTDTGVTYTRVGGIFCAGYLDTGIYTTVSLAITGDYTLSFLYMRLEETIPYSPIITNNVTGDALTCIGMDDDTTARTITVDNTTSDSTYFSLYPTWEIFKWYHITVTREGSTITVYRDGVNIGSTSSGGTDTFSITRLGMRPVSSSNRHANYMAEIKIIESVLTTDQIAVEADNALGNLVTISA